MTEQTPLYLDLESRFGRIAALGEAAGMLHWDAATLMPDGGSEARSEQLSALNVTIHELLTDPGLGEGLERTEAEESGYLDLWQRANLREMKRRWLHANAVPSRLVEEETKAARRCEMIWREARAKSDFSLVKPAMQTLLSIVREVAAIKAEALGLSPYDALLDQFDPGNRANRIDPVFADLADFLPPFLNEVLDKQAAADAPLPLEGPFPTANQQALARKLMQAVGFDFAHGRLDVSLHPFCGGVPEDVRITTRYDEDNFLSAMMGVLHETGHALYERGLPSKWRRQPVGEARGMALHESQSLLMEMQACRSRSFVSFMRPLAMECLGGKGPAWNIDNLVKHYRRVERGFIRVDADEVTYPAHVILRYRLERALIGGDLSLDDLPGAWTDGMEELLGVRPPEDRVGVLQDIHWYDGAYGYFPTYTLGAMTAAQLFQTAVAEHPDIPEALGRGDFTLLLDWLRRKVHGRGSLLSADELLAEATGRPLDPDAFKFHLRQRYLEDV
ncbi:carboxypeptidase M32 [Limibacillus halophilus]|uniref:Metal-dependent carboxypeptidase n=1 Tax=Limibacillus halophilus TaxID=1579333 RepID=A0A839SYQ2_9PROT|nr:carboxypeptidase M32 [Limibacillus halophilus]MBB3066706.1 carboxypeptidase Taq [Limibacillus halophilus]